MKRLYRIVLLIIVLIFLSTYSPSGSNLIVQKNNTFLKIQKIEIVNNSLIKNTEIKEKLSKFKKEIKKDTLLISTFKKKTVSNIKSKLINYVS